MTPFVGFEFLNIYSKERKKYLSYIEKKNVIQNYETMYLNLKQKNYMFTFEGSTNFQIENILGHYLISFEDDNFSKKILPFINKIIKKFEIQKLLFNSYNLEFEPTSTITSNLRNYLFLSKICLDLYEKSNNLKFLNTALKINDTLSSNFTNIKDELDLNIFYYCLTLELKFIIEISEKKGINIENWNNINS
jgi:hypothetical protein